jgi:hypothetical protein
VLALCAWPAVAGAQPTDATKRATAQALYDEGMKLVNAKDYARACPKFEEAAKLVPDGIGVKLQLAECYEASGKLASAWTLYRIVESEASRTNQEARRAEANAHMTALEPKLARIVVDVAPALREMGDLVVTRDGVEVASALFGVAVPVDGGKHTVLAKAASGTYEATVESVDGKSLTITVDKLSAGGTPQTPTDTQPKATSPTESLPPPATGDDSKASSLATPGFVIGGIGVAILGAGIGLGVKAMLDAGEADDICPETECNSQAAVDLSSQANTFSIIGWVGIGVGVAAVTTGIVLIALPSRDGEAPAAAFSVTPGGGRLRVTF